MNKPQSLILNILKDEMKPALGVTEPVSVALGAATAYQALGGEIGSIRLVLDPMLFKNGILCKIPGTDNTGFELAALLGALKGAPEAVMEVLKNVEPEDVVRAKELIAQGLVQVLIKADQPGLFVEVELETDQGRARVLILDRHDNIVRVEVNDRAILSKEGDSSHQEAEHAFNALKIRDFIDLARQAEFQDISFVLAAVEVNTRLAQEGLAGQWGLGVGRKLKEALEAGQVGDDLSTEAQLYVAAATDARLAGAKRPAMSIAGSGTHGLTATLPVAVAARRLGLDDQTLARALVLSFAVTIFMKEYTGRMSAFCGCATTSGAGVAAAIVFMRGGSDEQIENAVLMVAADVMGIICDGGNCGCSLKTSTGIASALKAALLVMDGSMIPLRVGVVGDSVEETIRNMGLISERGMAKVNDDILDIINSRTNYGILKEGRTQGG